MPLQREFKRAIISGDDFGLAPRINAGILRAHRDGILTSASISVAGPVAEAAAEAARSCPNLGIGLHLTLVAEKPVSNPELIPSMIDRDGRLHLHAFHFARRWLAGRIRQAEVREEIRAQLSLARRMGLEPTHLDAHQHLHVLPGVFEIVLEEMQRFGLSRVRIPLEHVTAERDPWTRRGLRFCLNRMARRAARLARRFNVMFPDRFLGFIAAGRITSEIALDWISGLGSGVTEMCFHPATGSEVPRPDLASWGYRWDRELATLLDPRVKLALRRQAVKRIHYGRLDSAG